MLEFPHSVAASSWPARDEEMYMQQIDRILAKRKLKSTELLSASVHILAFDAP